MSPEPSTEVVPASPFPPVTDLRDALIHLRRPFTPSAIRWKIQASGPKGAASWAIVIGYIDARLVVERLNMVCSDDWYEEPVPVEGNPNALLYKLTLFERTHIDIGVGQGADDGMKLKATHSDALKRVAVRFGVGVSLYAMPQMFLKVAESETESSEGEPTLLRLNSGKPGRLKDKHEAWLRSLYQRWLETEGIANFGEPLDHGDARTGSTGALAEGLSAEEPENAGESDPEPLTDPKAKNLEKATWGIFEEICAINPDRILKGRIAGMLKEARHSHEALEHVVARLQDGLDSERELSALEDEAIEKLGAEKAKPLIERAERKGSNRERIAALRDALSPAESSEGDEPSKGTGERDKGAEAV